MKNLKPLYDKILVELTKEQETINGIFLPTQEKSQTGKVIAVGNGRIHSNGTTTTLRIKEGDTVYFGKYSGTSLPDEQYLILREDEVIGIID